MICLLLTALLCNAQSNTSISIRVKDSATQKPVPFATVILLDASQKQVGGGFTDTSGFIRFNMSTEKTSVDQMIVSGIGFHAKKGLKLQNKTEVFLSAKVNALADVLVKKKELVEEQWHNFKQKWNYSAQFCVNEKYCVNMQVALHIKNPQNKIGFIKQVGFWFRQKHKDGDLPFRIRIYSVADSCQCPGEDLLLDNIIVEDHKKSGWFLIDVFKYRIRIPESGFFVAIEWLKPFVNIEDEAKRTNEETIKYGPDIELLLNQPEKLAFIKVGAKPWYRFLDKNDNAFIRNPLFKAVLMIE